jgi:hypothetical protein
MARVSHISLEMVRKLRGIIDFYYWKGIPCARDWPTRKKPYSQTQLEAREAFAVLQKDIQNMSMGIKLMWRAQARLFKRSWRDELTKRFFQVRREYRVKFPPVLLAIQEENGEKKLIVSRETPNVPIVAPWAIIETLPLRRPLPKE